MDKTDFSTRKITAAEGDNNGEEGSNVHPHFPGWFAEYCPIWPGWFTCMIEFKKKKSPS